MALRNVVQLIIETVGAKRAAGELDATERKTKSLGAATAGLAKQMLAGVGLVGALAAGADQLRRFANEADRVAKFSDRIKVSTEFVSEMGFVAKRSGVQITALEMALQRGQRRLETFVQTGKGEAAPVFAQMGLSADILAGKYRNIEELLPVLADRFKALAAEGRGTYEAQKLFDSEGVAMVQILGQGSDAVENLRKKFRDLGGTITKDGAESAVAFNDAMTDLKATIEGFRNVVAPPILDQLSAMVSGLVALRGGGLDEHILGIGAAATVPGTGIVGPQLPTLPGSPTGIRPVPPRPGATPLSPQQMLESQFGAPWTGVFNTPGLWGAGAAPHGLVAGGRDMGIDQVTGNIQLAGVGVADWTDKIRENIESQRDWELTMAGVGGATELLAGSMRALSDTVIDGGNVFKIRFGDVAKRVLKEVVAEMERAIAKAIVLKAALSFGVNIGSGGGSGVNYSTSYPSDVSIAPPVTRMSGTRDAYHSGETQRAMDRARMAGVR